MPAKAGSRRVERIQTPVLVRRLDPGFRRGDGRPLDPGLRRGDECDWIYDDCTGSAAMGFIALRPRLSRHEEGLDAPTAPIPALPSDTAGI